MWPSHVLPEIVTLVVVATLTICFKITKTEQCGKLCIEPVGRQRQYWKLDLTRRDNISNENNS